MADTVIQATKLAPSDAIRFFRQKINMPTQKWGELEAHVHATGFSVAGAASDALLNDFRKAVGRAISEGMTLGDFRKEFDRIVKRRGWDFNGTPGWRAKIIYTTNLSTAYSAGRWKQMTTPEALVMFPYFRYRHHSCPHPRLMHVAWDGIILPAGDTWWNTHWTPNGWHCHCSVEPVSRGEMRRNNWQVSDSPPLDLKPWRNPATGKTEMVPAGIDPGFQSNPGKLWMEAEKKRAETALKPVTSVQGRMVSRLSQDERQSVQREEIGKLLDNPVGSVEAGTVPDAVREQLGSRTDSVLLSDDSLTKNRTHHAELTRAEYEALPEMLSAPVHTIPTHPGRALLISRNGKQLYRLALKTTQDSSENWLLSMHAISEAEVSRLLRAADAKIITEE
ncbi:MAG: phage head morphogenesis protein [Acetobacter sp.]|nr:phage head morphogenesis protein [Acetobacter sp.]MCH4060549.1 phage head morphogenesis protein [Acetobacter sp.]MCH4087489.1 phage head morphogenesis protein [Acetobacter sp.]MCI1294690.1 phage head morphogenesis protein [Acetobacter sp.]MCI1321161.1 phage head morphogenesis protein [Acetobacter sp.]